MKHSFHSFVFSLFVLFFFYYYYYYGSYTVDVVAYTILVRTHGMEWCRSISRVATGKKLLDARQSEREREAKKDANGAELFTVDRPFDCRNKLEDKTAWPLADNPA